MGGDRVRSAWSAWRGADELLSDGALAGALLVGAILPGLAREGIVLGELHRRPGGPLSVALVLMQAVPVVGRRRAPGTALVLSAAGFIAFQLLGYAPTFASAGLLVCCYSAGAHLRSRRRLAAGVALAVYVGLAVALHLEGSPNRAVDFVTFAAVPVACACAGVWIDARQRAAHARLRASSRQATEQERARIARELHDVITHHVTAIVVQADAAAYAGEDPAQSSARFAAIADTARQALRDLREQLGVLHGDAATRDGPREPTALGLRELVDGAARAGQRVTLRQAGGAVELDDARALAARRVVQEALTNAMKHAPGQATTVTVHEDGRAVMIEVVTAASAHDPAPARLAGSGSGLGLAGLRARVGSVSGELEAGRQADGSFAVRARLPHPPATR